MRYLITGSSGMLGGYLLRFFRKNESNDVFGCDIKTKNEINLDLTKFQDVRACLEKVKPDIIIHCAALINVDLCDEDKHFAKSINTDVSINLAKVCSDQEIKFVFISTDAVFSGSQMDPYKETSTPDPVNYYGMSKLLAEKGILNENPKSLILRTNIYGWLNSQERKSFAEWVYSSLVDNSSITMFTDVFYSPIYIGNLAQVIKECLKDDLIGLYHCGGSEKCSKYDFGVKLAEVFGLDSTLISKGSYKKFNYRAKRSGYMVLDSSSLQSKVNTRILDVLDGLKLFKSEKENI